jgi:hypothetical protein
VEITAWTADTIARQISTAKGAVAHAGKTMTRRTSSDDHRFAVDLLSEIGARLIRFAVLEHWTLQQIAAALRAVTGEKVSTGALHRYRCRAQRQARAAPMLGQVTLRNAAGVETGKLAIELRWLGASAHERS